MKVLLVIDMQNDFVDGALGTPEAVSIVPGVVKKIKEFDGVVLFTKDTHLENYLETQEGKKLPVPHCIKGTEGWEIIPEIRELPQYAESKVYEKPTFGSVALAEELQKEYEAGRLESVEIIGLCTDICVVSNALLIKAFMPELPLFVDAACCAGVTPASHEAALRTMTSCQVNVIGGAL